MPSSKGFILKENRDRNRPMAKMPKSQLVGALAASDRIHEVSREIRRRAGLKPLERSLTYRLASERLRGDKGTLKASTDVSLGDLAKRRQKVERDRQKVDANVRTLVESKTVPVSMIAKALGISRQRVYQLAA